HGAHFHLEPARVIRRRIRVVVIVAALELCGVRVAFANDFGSAHHGHRFRAGVVDEHSIALLHLVPQVVARLVIAHAVPAGRLARRGHQVVEGEDGRFGLEQPVPASHRGSVHGRKSGRHETLETWNALQERPSRRTRRSAADASGTFSASASSRYTTPNAPNTAAALSSAARREAGRPANRNRTPIPAAPAPRAAAHSRTSSPAGTSALPTRREIPRRSSANSTHPATPAEAVRPTAPSLGSRCSARGNQRPQKTPRPAVSTTRTAAYLSGVRVSRSA